MSQHLSSSASLVESLATVRQILDLVATFEKLSDPVTSAAGLREAITLLEQLAAASGVNPDALATITRVLNEDVVFNVLLAAGQYLASVLANSGSASNTTAPAS